MLDNITALDDQFRINHDDTFRTSLNLGKSVWCADNRSDDEIEEKGTKNRRDSRKYAGKRPIKNHVDYLKLLI